MRDKKPYGLEEKKFFTFLVKLHERLTIILDDNVSKSVDPVESDVILLTRLIDFYDQLLEDEAITDELMEPKQQLLFEQ